MILMVPRDTPNASVGRSCLALSGKTQPPSSCTRSGGGLLSFFRSSLGSWRGKRSHKKARRAEPKHDENVILFGDP